MTLEVLEYCTRAVVRYLNGDMKLFKKYTNIAMKIYEQEKCIAAIGEMIPVTTRKKLYEMVG